jgi:hypothetical protein
MQEGTNEEKEEREVTHANMLKSIDTEESEDVRVRIK